MYEKPIGLNGGRYAEAESPKPGDPVVGVLIFLASETMFFAGLVTAFLVSRAASLDWPPLGQPRLPVLATAFNSAFLLASGFTMWRALQDRRCDQANFQRWVAVTAGLGAIFLALQGVEWIRLLRFGLKASSGLYGATFYTIVGAHALHVAAAVAVLLLVALRARQRHLADPAWRGVTACAIYWWFVVGLWPILYALVYLS